MGGDASSSKTRAATCSRRAINTFCVNTDEGRRGQLSVRREAGSRRPKVGSVGNAILRRDGWGSGGLVFRPERQAGHGLEDMGEKGGHRDKRQCRRMNVWRAFGTTLSSCGQKRFQNTTSCLHFHL